MLNEKFNKKLSTITHRWESQGKAVWEKFYGERNAVNLGFRATGPIPSISTHSPGRARQRPSQGTDLLEAISQRLHAWRR